MDEEQPRLLAPIVSGEDPEPDICHQQAYTWEQLLAHLESTHRLSLHPIVDYCSMCHCLFANRTQGVMHFLQHASTFKHMNPSSDKENYHCSDCSRHFENINLALAHFALEVRFDVDYDERAEEIHKFLEEASKEAEEEDKEIEEIMSKMNDDGEDLFSRSVTFAEEL